MVLKRVIVAQEKNKSNELALYNLGARFTGKINLFYDYKQIKKLLRPRHIEYRLTYR